MINYSVNFIIHLNLNALYFLYMKEETKKIYGHFELFKRTIENGTLKKSYTSLEKYQKSPYLQRVINHSNKKGLFKNGSKIDRIDQINSKSQIQQDDKKKEKDTKKHFLSESNNQLPQITTPIKSSDNSKYFLKAQFELNQIHQIDRQSKKYQKLENSIESHSATLEVNTKIKKLIPLQKQHKIHSVSKTKAGTTGRQAKTNQDIAMIETKFTFGLKLYGVCDGHGINGHLVSAFIKSHLIKNLNNALKKQNSIPSIAEIREIINDCLTKTNQQLLESDINTQLSGSTVIAVFIYQNRILAFNVGDSRAILIQKEDKAEFFSEQKRNIGAKQISLSHFDQFKKSIEKPCIWQVILLSVDQKPEREDERQRILKFGGRIFCQKSEKGQDIGPLRVWMKDLQMPGLAMTRSFGDKAGLKSGTNGIPQIIQHQINHKDKFIVIASDGVWQYLSNEQVMNLIIPFYLRDDIDSAAQKVVKIASQTWHRVSFSRDDITIIIVSLNSPQK